MRLLSVSVQNIFLSGKLVVLFGIGQDVWVLAKVCLRGEMEDVATGL